MEYHYNLEGNVSGIYENGEQKVRYEYDRFGQLVREDSLYAGKTTTYAYDNYGNILAWEEYDYTLEKPSNLIDSKKYEYGDDEWKDLLTKFDGQQIVYDEIGNPLLYRDEYACGWHGRTLESIKTDDTDISYSYNSEGVRLSKEVNGEKTVYHIDGTVVLYETTEGETKWYLYDENSSIIGFQYKETTYYFEKNTQGDIVRIFDENGEFICEYFYDAWGNIVNIEGNKELAMQNPFRYRGYYYDEETGFYYLQSRYYDSITGRFINADDTMYLGMSNSIASYNLYTYANNNPSNEVDYLGNVSIEIALCGTLVIVGLTFLTWYMVKLLAELTVLIVKLVWHMGKVILTVIKDVMDVVQQSIYKAIKKVKRYETELHHIIARNAWRMQCSRNIWVDKCKNSINDSRNLVYVNYNLHRVMHTNMWYSTVDNYVQVAYKEGGEKQVVDCLKAIKLILQVASAGL